MCCKMLVVHCVDVCHCMSYVCADQCSFTVAGVGSGDSGAVCVVIHAPVLWWSSALRS